MGLLVGGVLLDEIMNWKGLHHDSSLLVTTILCHLKKQIRGGGSDWFLFFLSGLATRQISPVVCDISSMNKLI
ncbi:hypothetical protein IMY05_007G0026800 [Salix suchowensis]|nr:hypothetical protein IMY05_007G0026800 [Salix suchowensis]